MEIQWKDIPGYSKYEASNTGELRIKKTLKICCKYVNNGYYRVKVKPDGAEKFENRRLNRLIALAWVENPDPATKNQVNHINGDEKLNNHHTNLEWVSAKENMAHFHATTFRAKKVRLIFSSETETMEFESISAAALYFGLAPATVWGYSLNGKWHGYKIERIVQVD
jgi:hypothetical protein